MEAAKAGAQFGGGGIGSGEGRRISRATKERLVSLVGAPTLTV
jgi:hypothetical protein